MMNQKLLAARKEKGWSIEVASVRVGVSRVTYSRWENGHQEPQPIVLEMLCEAFGKPADELGFGHLSKKPALAASGGETSKLLHQYESPLLMLTREQAATFLALLGNDMKHFDPSKRETLKILRKAFAMVGVTIVGSQFADTEPWEQLERLIVALKKPSSIDAVTLNGLQNATESYWQLRVRGFLATPDLLDTVLRHYRTITQLLQGSHLPSTRTHLSATASQTALLVGMLLSTDMHKHDQAKIYYETALTIAQQANNDALYAACLGRMSSVAAATDKPKEARSLLQEAQCLVPQSDTFTLRAWLAAEEAEIQATIAAQENIQNTSTCFKVLENAEVLANQISSGEDTFGMYFDISRIPAYRGSCAIRLHRPDEAIESLKVALEPLKSSGTLSRAVLLDLAEASIQATAVEQACDYIKQSLEISIQVQATGSLQRIHSLRRLLKPWSAVEDVRDLDERLRAFT